MPKVIIADTIKGKGVSFMEHTSIDSDVEFYKFHSGAPSDDAYLKAAQELIDYANAKLAAINVVDLELSTVSRLVTAKPQKQQRLIGAYSNSLLKHARKNPKIIALDADLMVDTGLLSFQKEFPDRFIECGIAEQDMVSQAGGIALQGFLPIVHSFSCFLSSRPNEQIYNNATERTKIIYVGSLAGVLPGGPGHSHQAVRDIGALKGIPNLIVIEPSNESEVEKCLEYAIYQASGPVYIRLVSIPYEVTFEFSEGYKFIEGCGNTVHPGDEVLIVAYGPIMVSEAYKAAEIIGVETGIKVGVVAMPWLNRVDKKWMSERFSSAHTVFVIDNHNIDSGLANIFGAAIADCGLSRINLERIGLLDIPEPGQNDELLEYYGFNSINIAKRIKECCLIFN